MPLRQSIRLSTSPKILLAVLLTALITLAGCATGRPALEFTTAEHERRVATLARDIAALGSDVDPLEAERAARLAIEYSLTLAERYEISGSSPVYHNLLVNLGIKPRGLCIDWTEDLTRRLKKARFHSLDLHWAIANYRSAFRLEHSTVVISARGDSLYDGLVLDPWRYSGRLFWAPTRADADYSWEPRATILALKRELEAEAGARSAAR